MTKRTIMISLPCRVLDYCIYVEFDDSELYLNLVLLYGKYVHRFIHTERRILNIFVKKRRTIHISSNMILILL